MQNHLRTSFAPPPAAAGGAAGAEASRKVRRTAVTRVSEAVKALALCHNVTPVYENVEGSDTEQSDTEADQQSQQHVVYQASSPDEVFHSPSDV